MSTFEFGSDAVRGGKLRSKINVLVRGDRAGAAARYGAIGALVGSLAGLLVPFNAIVPFGADPGLAAGWLAAAMPAGAVAGALGARRVRRPASVRNKR